MQDLNLGLVPGRFRKVHELGAATREYRCLISFPKQTERSILFNYPFSFVYLHGSQFSTMSPRALKLFVADSNQVLRRRFPQGQLLWGS